MIAEPRLNGDIRESHKALEQGFFSPTRYFLVAGTGDAFDGLVAFDKALLNAGISDVNLIKLSSIVGPGVRRIEPVSLKLGSFVGVAYASTTSAVVGERIASAVAIAHPTDKSRASLVMEHSDSASREEVEEYVKKMAIEGMHSRNLSVDFVEVIGAELVVQRVGATFAGVVEL